MSVLITNLLIVVVILIADRFIEGCSFYKLPAVLRWFSSNIGIHHVHHLSPRIPNNHLKKCFDAVPALQAKVSLTFVSIPTCCFE